MFNKETIQAGEVQEKQVYSNDVQIWNDGGIPDTVDNEGKYHKTPRRVIFLNVLFDDELTDGEKQQIKDARSVIANGEVDNLFDAIYKTMWQLQPIHLNGTYINLNYMTKNAYNKTVTGSARLTRSNGYLFNNTVLFPAFEGDKELKITNSFSGKVNLSDQTDFNPISWFWQHCKNHGENLPYPLVTKVTPYKRFVFVKLLDVSNAQEPKVCFLQLTYGEDSQYTNFIRSATSALENMNETQKEVSEAKNIEFVPLQFRNLVWEISKVAGKGGQYVFKSKAANVVDLSKYEYTDPDYADIYKMFGVEFFDPSDVEGSQAIQNKIIYKVTQGNLVLNEGEEMPVWYKQV